MSIDTNALIKAAGIGAVVILILAGSSNAVGIVAPDIAVLSIVCCCIAYLFYAIIGVGYAFFAQQNQTPMDVGMMALGGALSAVIASVVQMFVNIIGLLLVGAPSAFAQLGGVDQTAAVAGGLAGGLIGLCIVFVVSAAMGAAGGAIYAAVSQPKTTTPAA